MATSRTLLLHGQAVSRGIRSWDCDMPRNPKPVFRLDHRGIAASSGDVLLSTWDSWTEIGDRADVSPGFIYGRMLDMNAPGLWGVSRARHGGTWWGMFVSLVLATPPHHGFGVGKYTSTRAQLWRLLFVLEAPSQTPGVRPAVFSWLRLSCVSSPSLLRLCIFCILCPIGRDSRLDPSCWPKRRGNGNDRDRTYRPYWQSTVRTAGPRRLPQRCASIASISQLSEIPTGSPEAPRARHCRMSMQKPPPLMEGRYADAPLNNRDIGAMK